jgi:hypothetical protein
LVNQRLLFVRQPLRIADNVEKQDMDNFEFDFLIDLGRHAGNASRSFVTNHFVFHRERRDQTRQKNLAIESLP